MRAFVVFLCWVLCLSPWATAQNLRLPDLGDGAEITLGAERRLGDSIAREIFRDPDYLDDPVLGDYVLSIWGPLLVAARQRGELSPEMEQQFAWKISLVRDRSINAFALPGGYLGVHLGLISAVSSADELASVLAHELTHVTQRHIARMMEQQGRQGPVLIGAMILGMLAASRAPVNSSNMNAANAMIVGGQAVAIQSQLNFSRDMEREADRIGFGVLNDAGFAPQSFVTMFEKLQQAARLNDNGAYPYLRSHPMTTERIADAQARQQLLGVRPPVALMPLHAMMAARAQVLVRPGVDALRVLAAQADAVSPRPLSTAEQAGRLYGAVLATQQLREFADMQRHLSRLQSLTGLEGISQQVVRWLSAEVALASPAPQASASQALALMTQSATLVPDAWARTRRFLLAQARVATGQPEQMRTAAQELALWVNQRPRDALGWSLLSLAYQAQGDALRSIRAQAEARMAEFDVGAAVDRFKAAQELALQLGREGRLDRAGHVEASIIDARLRESERLRREQALQR